jgi:hypothetical protein
VRKNVQLAYPLHLVAAAQILGAVPSTPLKRGVCLFDSLVDVMALVTLPLRPAGASLPGQFIKRPWLHHITLIGVCIAE